MNRKKTYINPSVLIAAFEGTQKVSRKAQEILDDENREFASSCFVQLEVLPKAVFNKQKDEAEFYETFFSAVIHWANDLEKIMQEADQIARTYNLTTMDAIHVAAALQIKADELITTKKETKTRPKVPGIKIIALEDFYNPGLMGVKL